GSASPADLGDDLQSARLVLAHAGAGTRSAFFERRTQIGTRRVERWNQSEQDAGKLRDHERERQHAPVGGDITPPSPIRGMLPGFTAGGGRTPNAPRTKPHAPPLTDASPRSPHQVRAH